MKLMKLAALAVLIVFGAAMAQEVEKKVELKVMVAGDEASEVHWVSDDMGFELDDLAIGETRTIAGDSGRDVTVTRTEAGMQFNIDGETVVVPDIGAHEAHMAFIDVDDVHTDMDIDVEVIGEGAHVMSAHHPNHAKRSVVFGPFIRSSTRPSAAVGWRFVPATTTAKHWRQGRQARSRAGCPMASSAW